jgi:hypothetical protein
MAKRFFPLYNLDQPVGPGKPNLPDDVRLVQNLFIELSRFYANDWYKDIPPEQRGLSTTSRFDDQLESWIKTYQNWLVKGFGGPASFRADGIIDPMIVHSISLDVSFKSGRISTLAMLCNQLWRFDRNAYLRVGDLDNMKWFPEGFIN